MVCHMALVAGVCRLRGLRPLWLALTISELSLLILVSSRFVSSCTSDDNNLQIWSGWIPVLEIVNYRISLFFPASDSRLPSDQVIFHHSVDLVYPFGDSAERALVVTFLRQPLVRDPLGEREVVANGVILSANNQRFQWFWCDLFEKFVRASRDTYPAVHLDYFCLSLPVAFPWSPCM